jgi:hypothetical protein
MILDGLERNKPLPTQKSGGRYKTWGLQGRTVL